MKVTDIVVDAAKTLGGQALLVAVLPQYEYANGHRTETQIGWSYEVVLPRRGYEKIRVRIPGDMQLEKDPNVDNVPVVFDGLEMSIYWANGTYGVSAHATGIHRAKAAKGGD